MNEMIKRIRMDILSKMIELDCQVGHVLQTNWIYNTYITQLNSNERQYVELAIQSLKDDGYVTYEEIVGGVLILTQDVYDFIYNKN